MLLCATALDRAGNRSEAEIGVTVDTTPPTAQLFPLAGGVVSAAPVAFAGVADDANLDHWSLELGRGPPGLAVGFFEVARGTTAVPGDLLAELVTLPADGLYTVRLRVTDRAGHVVTDELGVTIDTLPPAPPSGLVATVDAAGDVDLRWTASPDADLFQYRVLRGRDAQALLQVGLVPAAVTAYRDLAVPDGGYRYAVVAVGVGGLSSAPTPELPVTVDTSVPVASIAGPVDGARVSGIVQVSGRAWARDLRGYRLLVSRGGASFTEVASGSTPVNGGLLGAWDTLTGADGLAELRLEAEGASGRVATAEVAVVVDNTPRASPCCSRRRSPALAWRWPGPPMPSRTWRATWCCATACP